MDERFEAQLRQALRREALRLPVLVDAAMIERRLMERTRLFPAWVSLAAIPAAAALLLTALLLYPRRDAAPSASPTSEPRPTATVPLPTATPDTSPAIGWQAAWTVSDGRLYFFGGVRGGPLASAHAFEPPRWYELPPMPEPRAGAAAVATPDGQVFVLGGFTTRGEWLDSTLILNEGTERWSYGPVMPNRQAFSAAAHVDGRVYLFGGGYPGHGDDLLVLDIASGQWEAREPMPSTLSYAGLATVGDQIYLFGGKASDVQPASSAAYRYTPAENRWNRLADMPVAGTLMAAAVANDRIWVFGAPLPEDDRFGTVQTYDPATDAWTRSGLDPDRYLLRRSDAALVLPSGQIMLIGRDGVELIDTADLP